jgi:hypothetical protein
MKKVFSSVVSALFCLVSNAQLLQSFTQENWMNSNWQNANRSLYFYDASENLSGSEYYSWNANNQEFVLSVIENNYRNEVGRLDSVILTTMTFPTMEFIPSTKINYGYNAEGLLDTLLYSSYSNDIFVPSSLTTYVYDENNFIIERYSSFWDIENEIWVPSSKLESTLNSEGQSNVDINYLFSEDIQQWIENTRVTYTYYQSGKVSSLITEGFIGGSWRNSSRVLNEYDNSNNLIMETRDIWNNADNEWRNNTRTNYTNTSFNKVAQFVSEFWNNTEWINGQRGTYIYSEPSGLKRVSELNPVVYPNPSGAEIRLNIEENSDVHIFDALGNLVSASINYVPNEALSTKHLNPGLYLITVKNSSGVKAIRFIKAE